MIDIEVSTILILVGVYHVIDVIGNVYLNENQMTNLNSFIRGFAYALTFIFGLVFILEIKNISLLVVFTPLIVYFSRYIWAILILGFLYFRIKH